MPASRTPSGGGRPAVDATTVGLSKKPGAGTGSSGLSLRVVGESMLDDFRLPTSGEILIGRGAEAALRIDHASISRKHAIVSVDDERVRLKDLGSANGTRVGDRPVEPGQWTDLLRGEVVDLGSVMLILQGGYREAPRRPAEELFAGEGAGGEGEVERRASSVIVADPAMERLYRLVDRIAPGDISVLVLGETGSGKEVVAEEIHRRSRRAEGPFLRLNCGGFSEALLESELFGHEKGAFTGAARAKPGLLETAHGGTVFLDEIGELAPALQVKLLRVLEDCKVMRVGALTSRDIDVRFVAATNRDLEAEAASGRFREDLYYRLSGVTLVVPPLRERVAEIPALARLFSAAAAERAGWTRPSIAAEAAALLEAYDWPGNIRELRNVMERAVLLSAGSKISPEHLPTERLVAPRPAAAPGRGESLREELDEVERRRVVDALEACGQNQTRAAKLLGISRNTLAAKMDAFGIDRPRKKRR